MATAGGRHVIVYNGECYNYRELKASRELAAIEWRSSSDAEVVLELLAREGEGGLQRMRGMYAGALWDEDSRRLLLFRDRLGIKPVYYAMPEPGLFMFASEVRAMLASGLVGRRVSPEAVVSYLAYGAVQCPYTMLEGVVELPPAHFLVIDDRASPRCQRYWQFLFSRGVQDGSGGSAERIRSAFLHAVGSHLVSDVPVGVFLSGGVDSGAIACAASGEGDLMGVTVTFPDAPEFDEGRRAREVAEFAGIRHVEVPMSGSDLRSCLTEALACQDEPTCDGLNTYVVSHAARAAGLKVALSGLGGDELFAGYPSFRDVPLIWRLRRALGALPLAREVCAAAGVRLQRLRKLQELASAPSGILSAYLVRRRLFTSAEISALLPGLGIDGWVPGIESERFEHLRDACASLSSSDAVSLAELSVYMLCQLLRDSDCMGMAQGLEIRVPFLDVGLVEAACALGDHVRDARNGAKRAFVHALGDILHPEIGTHRKQGFALPLQEWLLRDLRPEAEEVLLSGALCRALGFDAQTVARLWGQFVSKPKAVWWARPWALIALGRYLAHNDLL
jgi:asparagine synthase (glutamine-hydrolysing)